MDTQRTIMVVDDNPDIITIVKTILEGKGYNVLSASSGQELLSL
jgi:CheY-like chemotaxis protein